MVRRRRLLRIAGLAAAAALVIGGAIRQPGTVHAAGAEGFLVLQPGFTQTLWGTYSVGGISLGGVAFATNGDVLADHCQFSGSSLTDYSQTGTTVVNGSTLHNHAELPSNAGCGLTNHPNGTLYSNLDGGVINLNATTGATINGPFGPGGNALGIATDPLAPNNLIYVGAGGDLDSVDAALTTSSTFSTTDPGDFKDQITWSPDGQFLFVSNRGTPLKLQIVNRAGALVQNVTMTSEPDGIAFHASAPQFVVTSNTDGTMTRFDFPLNNYAMPPVQTVFASGGFRGDNSAVGKDGCMYLTQAGTRYFNGVTSTDNSIVQICGGFAPGPGVDEPIKATGVPFSATEGTNKCGAVATFTDPDTKAVASDYSATIDWGDGTPVDTTATISGGGGNFTVSGCHTYAEEGSYKIVVTITDTDNKSTTTVNTTAAVADAALTSACAAPAVLPAGAFAGATATFTDANPNGTLTDFSATINWGDGTPDTAGVITGPVMGSGPYTVSGTHVYTKTGPIVITTTIKDIGGSTTVATCNTSRTVCDNNENDGEGNIKDDHSDKHTSDNRDAKFHSDQDDDNSECDNEQEESGDTGDNDQKQVDEHDNRTGDDFHSTQVQSVNVENLVNGKKATITGVGLHNGNVVSFTVVEIDNGPGLPGFFSLVLSDGYDVAGSLVDGTIALN